MVLFVTAGCGDREDYVFTGNQGTPIAGPGVAPTVTFVAPSNGATDAPVTALPQFLHPGHYQVFVSVLAFTREGSKVYTQPLILRPLPAEGISPRHLSRLVGRLRDWSKSKLPPSTQPAKP